MPNLVWVRESLKTGLPFVLLVLIRSISLQAGGELLYCIAFRAVSVFGVEFRGTKSWINRGIAAVSCSPSRVPSYFSIRVPVWRIYAGCRLVSSRPTVVTGVLNPKASVGPMIR